MPNSGKSLEQLVTRLEKLLASSKNITVESRKRLRDKKTGRLREHDIIVTIREAHHSVTIALECRDRSRPIGVIDVEAFSRKCEDTGINQGIMVSARGFYNSAKIKAAGLDIRCLTIKEALCFDWFTATNLRTEQVNINQIHVNFVLQSEQTSEALTDYTLVDTNGIEVPYQLLSGNTIEQLRSLREQQGNIDSGLATFFFDGQGYGIRDNPTGIIYPLEQIVVEAKYEVKVEFSPIKFSQYSDEAVGKVISDAAMAQLNLEDFKGDIAIVRSPEQGLKLAFFPSSGNKATLKRLKDGNGT